MTTLYELSEGYRSTAQRLADLEMDDVTIRDTLESIVAPLEEKATAVAMVARNMEATAAAIKDAEAQMSARRKALEARAERLRSYLLACMQATGIQKIESAHFTLAVRQNPPAVVVDEPGLIPEGYYRQKPPPPPEIDKAAIAAALKNGADVPGAHLTRGYRLEVK